MVYDVYETRGAHGFQVFKLTKHFNAGLARFLALLPGLSIALSGAASMISTSRCLKVGSAQPHRKSLPSICMCRNCMYVCMYVRTYVYMHMCI